MVEDTVLLTVPMLSAGGYATLSDRGADPATLLCVHPPNDGQRHGHQRQVRLCLSTTTRASSGPHLLLKPLMIVHPLAACS